MWLVVRRSLHQSAAVDALVLRLPGFGPCLEAVALARFSLALRMTLDSGLSATEALRSSRAIRTTRTSVYRSSQRHPGVTCGFAPRLMRTHWWCILHLR